MFGAAAKKAAAYEKLRQVEAAYAKLETTHAGLLAIVAALEKRAFLVGIERAGKLNKFTFARNGSLSVIETYGTLSDDVNGWKKELLE
jgi:hypothetical protein